MKLKNKFLKTINIKKGNIFSIIVVFIVSFSFVLNVNAQIHNSGGLGTNSGTTIDATATQGTTSGTSGTGIGVTGASLGDGLNVSTGPDNGISAGASLDASFLTDLGSGGSGVGSMSNPQPLNPNIHGYAWSSNIGWISLNCADNNSCTTNVVSSGSGNTGGTQSTGVGNGAAFLHNILETFTNKVYAATLPTNYGVNMDPATGDLTGYAWSSNVGWISFNELGCPGSFTGNRGSTQPCQANINPSTGVMTGWARVLNGVNASDPNFSGFDGWISFKGANSAGVPYGVNMDISTGDLTGYAWGSSTVGWVEFLGNLVPATLTLTANPAFVTNVNDTTTLTWSSPSIPFVSCSIPTTSSTDWNTTMTPADLDASNSFSKSAVATVSTSPSTTYYIECKDPMGHTVPAQTTVTVCAVGDPNCALLNTPSVLIKADEVGNLTNTITSQADQPSSTNNPNPNTKTLTIPLGSSVNLSWGASGSANINYSTCLASSTPSSPWDNNWALGNAWTGAVIPVLGGPVNSTPSTNTLYKISCNDVNGVLVSSSIKVVTIDCSTDPSNPVCVTKSGLWDLGSPAHSTCDRDKNGDFITKLKFAISPWNPGYNCTLVSTDMNNQTSSTSSIVTVPNPPTNTSSPYTIPYNIVVPYPVTNFSLSCMHNPAGKTDPVIAVGKDTVSQCKPYVGLSVPACVKPKPDNNATVSWSTSLMSSCKITSPGNPDFIIPTGDIAADSTFPPLSVQPPSTVFTLECMGLDNLWHTYQSPAVLVDANCDKTIPPKKPPHFIER